VSALLSLVATNAVASLAIALVAWAAGRATRRQAVVHGLWLLALVKLVTPPLVPIAVLPDWSALRAAPDAPLAVRMPPVPAATARASAPERTRASLPPPAVATRTEAGLAVPPEAAPAPAARPATRPSPANGPETALPWRELAGPLAAAALALGAIAVTLATVIRFRRFRRLLASAEPAPPAVKARADALATGFGLRAAPPVLVVPAPVPPMLWPSRRGPLLLLPEPLVRALSADERDALLAHELAHVRRRDHWVRFVEIGATALFWWYPVAWWARASLRRAEERCCDEWVLRVLPSCAGAYASGLLKSLELVAAEADPLPAGASGAGPVRDLEARLKEILMTRPLPRLAAPVRLGLAAAAMAGLAVFPTHAASRAADPPPVASVAPTTPPPAEAPAPSRPQARTAPAVAPVARVSPAAPAAVVAPVEPAARPRLAPVAVAGTPAARAATAPAVGVAPAVAGRASTGFAPSPAPQALGAAAPALASPGAPAEEDPALAAERRALEEQRRALRAQAIELERRTLAFEAKANEKRLAGDVARLRAEGRTRDAERAVKEVGLEGRRLQLQEQQLQLEVESAQLEALEEKAGSDEAAAAEIEHARQVLEEKHRALEAKMEKAAQEMAAADAEARVDALRESTGDLERSIAERIESLRAELPAAGAQRAELEHEIQRLQSALDALGERATGTKMRTPAPQRMKRPAPPTPAPAQP
jgi:beta-lactamase regulating signal transducer with metallopeptidase domain